MTFWTNSYRFLFYFILPYTIQLTEKLLDLENENIMRVAELEKQLLQREKELEIVKVCWQEKGRGFSKKTRAGADFFI